jgi:DNA-directed RNA polymerase specialized sigma24 family protein
VIDELTYDEVAEQLDIRPTAARLRVSRALRRLAHAVGWETSAAHGAASVLAPLAYDTT